MTALNPRQARERAREEAGRRGRARIYQRRDALERVLIEQLSKQANVLREALRNQIDTCAMALAQANEEASRMADRIDPRVPDGFSSTSTSYDLETGSVGRDYLASFYRKVTDSVLASDWNNALNSLIRQLLRELTAVNAEVIYRHLKASVANNQSLLQHIHANISINEIISAQYTEEVAASRQRPDNRIHQWLDRLDPYIRWDADRYSFHESNLEHIRLAAIPTNREDNPYLMAATVGQEDIRFIPTGDPMRMDAVWIVHGLPVTLLERVHEYRSQYENSLDFPIREEFHLNPNWMNLPDVTPEDQPLPEPYAARDSAPATIPRVRS